jgi:catechol 2,3-dioxygenase-like lactoylglutathione lyase family enzyme
MTLSSQSAATIDRLRAVTLGVTDLERSVAFYTDLWGLEVVGRKPDAAFLRASGLDHHVLALQRADVPGLVSVTFGATTRDELIALYERLRADGVVTEQPPRELQAPGGGWGFAFHDPEGRVFKVVADRADYPSARRADTRPVKLAHVVMNSADATAAARFFIDVVRFRLSDQTAKMHFLRCSADHHSIAFCADDAATLNHVAFEMASWNELMFGVGRMKIAGHRVHWGVGRHGPGDNVFAYFIDPDGLAIEYTAEVQRIDEATHRAGGPAQWARPPERMDQWGHADLPSDEIKQAMHGASQHARAEQS